MDLVDRIRIEIVLGRKIEHRVDRAVRRVAHRVLFDVQPDLDDAEFAPEIVERGVAVGAVVGRERGEQAERMLDRVGRRRHAGLGEARCGHIFAITTP